MISRLISSVVVFLIVFFGFLVLNFQLLGLLEVIIDNAESRSNTSEEPGQSSSDLPTAAPVTNSHAEINTNSDGISSRIDVASSSKAEEVSQQPLNSNEDRETDSQSVLTNLPQEELRLLCSLLAREGYESFEFYCLLLLHIFLHVLHMYC